MKCGTVLFHSDFQFLDGDHADKRLVVLNAPTFGQPYLCCKTTSKPRFPDREGCHSSHNLYVLNPCPCFKLKTWVQFHEIYELDAVELLQRHASGQVREVGELPPETGRAIVNCVKRSDDISPYQLSFLT